MNIVVFGNFEVNLGQCVDKTRETIRSYKSYELLFV